MRSVEILNVSSFSLSKRLDWNVGQYFLSESTRIIAQLGEAKCLPEVGQGTSGRSPAGASLHLVVTHFWHVSISLTVPLPVQSHQCGWSRRTTMGVVQAFIHVVTPLCKCAIVWAYIFTFVTVIYIYYKYIVRNKKIKYIVNPPNELY